MDAVIGLLCQILTLYTYVILISVLLSWFSIGGGHPSLHRFQELLDRLTDPFLNPLRQALAPVSMRIGLDFSPLIGIMILQFIVMMLR